MGDTRNVVHLTLRLNLDNKAHYKIYEVLHSLDPNIYKSMNQFLVDAVDEKINRYDTEALVMGRSDDAKPLLKRDMAEIEKRIEDKVSKNVEAWVFELMSKALWGGRYDGVSVSSVQMPVAVEKGTMASEDELDDVLGDLASEWANNSGLEG